jgi:hypothetical protein
MKLPTVGWAFFGLTLFIAIVYALSIGVNVRSTIKFNARNGEGYYSGECTYLYLSGVRTVDSGTVGATPSIVADQMFCHVFAR